LLSRHDLKLTRGYLMEELPGALSHGDGLVVSLHSRLGHDAQGELRKLRGRYLNLTLTHD
jgi:hypothetical protein